MFVYTQLEPHLIFLILLLITTWSFGTWLTWQNRKLYCELVPKYEWVSKYGLVIGTLTMIFTLWFLSLFYNELRLGMTIIFASLTVGIGNYLARFLEWLVFIQDIDKGEWKRKITHYYYTEYGRGLGPIGSEQIMLNMIPEWWIKLLPKTDQTEIYTTLDNINELVNNYSNQKEKRFN